MKALQEAVASGARWHQACQAIELSIRTAQLWRDGDSSHADQRSTRVYLPKHRLTDAERAEILAVANSDEFGHLPQSNRTASRRSRSLHCLRIELLPCIEGG
jgi:hypothetical protein